MSSNAPVCNVSINGKEAYNPNASNIFSSAMSIPFLISSIVCSCILCTISGFISYTTYQDNQKLSDENKHTFYFACCLILCLCCCSSSILNSINAYDDGKTVKNATDNEKNINPCWSTTTNSLVN
jgi:hypothetical protein